MYRFDSTSRFEEVKHPPPTQLTKINQINAIHPGYKQTHNEYGPWTFGVPF